MASAQPAAPPAGSARLVTASSDDTRKQLAAFFWRASKTTTPPPCGAIRSRQTQAAEAVLEPQGRRARPNKMLRRRCRAVGPFPLATATALTQRRASVPATTRPEVPEASTQKKSSLSISFGSLPTRSIRADCLHAPLHAANESSLCGMCSATSNFRCCARQACGSQLASRRRHQSRDVAKRLHHRARCREGAAWEHSAAFSPAAHVRASGKLASEHKVLGLPANRVSPSRIEVSEAVQASDMSGEHANSSGNGNGA